LPVPTPEPVHKKVAPKPVKVAPEKPKEPASAKPAAMDPVDWAELNRSWAFYRKAVEEGITDREKIQTLESMLNRFGADGGYHSVIFQSVLYQHRRGDWTFARNWGNLALRELRRFFADYQFIFDRDC
jgi:hypothetical protein